MYRKEEGSREEEPNILSRLGHLMRPQKAGLDDNESSYRSAETGRAGACRRAKDSFSSPVKRFSLVVNDIRCEWKSYWEEKQPCILVNC